MNFKDTPKTAADIETEYEEILLGSASSFSLTHDPKHMVFVLARYKFCARMLEGKKAVMEIGSGDGLGLPLIAKSVGHLYCADWDERHIISIQQRLLQHFDNVTAFHTDMNEEAPKIKVDAAFSIDVLEHLEPHKEHAFIRNILSCLPDNGVLITGTPNITASQYASPCSAVQHINLKSALSLRELMEHYFENVFIMGMNDEVVHTGNPDRCHYLWSIAAGKKDRKLNR